MPNIYFVERSNGDDGVHVIVVFPSPFSTVRLPVKIRHHQARRRYIRRRATRRPQSAMRATAAMMIQTNQEVTQMLQAHLFDGKMTMITPKKMFTG
jgi:hypothetical protein